MTVVCLKSRKGRWKGLKWKGKIGRKERIQKSNFGIREPKSDYSFSISLSDLLKKYKIIEWLMQIFTKLLSIDSVCSANSASTSALRFSPTFSFRLYNSSGNVLNKVRRAEWEEGEEERWASIWAIKPFQSTIWMYKSERAALNWIRIEEAFRPNVDSILLKFQKITFKFPIQPRQLWNSHLIVSYVVIRLTWDDWSMSRATEHKSPLEVPWPSWALWHGGFVQRINIAQRNALREAIGRKLSRHKPKSQRDILITFCTSSKTIISDILACIFPPRCKRRECNKTFNGTWNQFRWLG